MRQQLIDEVAAETDRALLPFLIQHINPGTAQRDTTGSPLTPDLLRRGAEHGLFRTALPTPTEAYDPPRWGLTLEHLGYRCTDLSLPLLTYLIAGMIRSIRGRALTDLIDAGPLPLIGFAFTEINDPFDFTSRVTRHGDTLTLDAHKTIVAGATILDSFVVYARDHHDSHVAVLLHRTDPHVHITPLDVSGFRAAGFGTLTTTATRIPANRIIDHDGLAHAQEILNTEAAFFAAGPLGRMRAITQSCARHALTTSRHGTLLADYPNVQGLLGRMHARVETARAALYRALDMLAEADPAWNPLAWTAKYTIGEAGVQVATAAQRLLGTKGFLRETGVDRYLRDFSGLIAGGNPQDKLEIELGTDLLNTMTLQGPTTIMED